MKKLTTATIATLGLMTFGYATQNDADAAEQTLTASYSEVTHDYVTIDEQGNRHHTLDGVWNPSMFQQQLYQSSYVDAQGYMHYVYYTTTQQMNDNDYSNSYSHGYIRENGYPGYQQRRHQTEAYNASAQQWQVNTTDQLGQATKTQNHVQGSQLRTAPQNTNVQANTAESDDQTARDASWLTSHPQIQPYGQYHGGGAHYGVDYGMPVGTPVRSLTNGTVIESGWSPYGGGNQITIQEEDSNHYQWYMHMSQLNVQKGDRVTEGQQIGLSGNTGNSTAPHLHFQRMSGGVGNQYAVNPTSYLASKS
ncbi:M23 family metallopeptidase [Staphylococcus delphini]|uniref:M23 family metallopeptidase n=1 Tax=Staphylococcus delphini TaxID=53344 RepID=UPI000BBC2A3C|nr:M23 family metallopeptidase [Staphylococcus delphini]PCF85607.1 hypothetical protein B4W69_00390 [Staphylococcus delphini]HEC2172167.1 M23 family metallopeptidase [Staphylococcus delphini]